MEIPKNDPDMINYAYMYIHRSFASLLESSPEFNLLRRSLDEVRHDYSHEYSGYFKKFRKRGILECPFDPDSSTPLFMLSKLGIPFLIDTVFTEEYSKYVAFLTNPNLTEAAKWTSMDKATTLKQTSLDPKFFNDFSELRATHLTLNSSITLEETLNAYYSDRPSKP